MFVNVYLQLFAPELTSFLHLLVAGHGSQVPRMDGTEADNLDEGLSGALLSPDSFSKPSQ